MFDDAQVRLATLLGTSDGRKDAESLAALTKYGLGLKRSLDQLIAFTGDKRTFSLSLSITLAHSL